MQIPSSGLRQKLAGRLSAAGAVLAASPTLNRTSERLCVRPSSIRGEPELTGSSANWLRRGRHADSATYLGHHPPAVDGPGVIGALFNCEVELLEAPRLEKPHHIGELRSSYVE